MGVKSIYQGSPKIAVWYVAARKEPTLQMGSGPTIHIFTVCHYTQGLCRGHRSQGRDARRQFRSIVCLF